MPAATKDPILQEIARGEAAPAYLIHGPDGYRHEEVVAALRAALVPPGLEAMFFQAVDGASLAPEDLRAMADAVPFGGGRRLLVIRDVPAGSAAGSSRGGRGGRGRDGAGGTGAAASAVDALVAYLGDPSPATCLVLTCRDELASGHPLCRAVAARGRLVPAGLPGRGDLAAWARSYVQATWGKALAPDAAGLLVDRCRHERILLRGELDKLACYVGEREAISAGDVLAVVGKTREESVFELLDAVGERRGALALRLVREYGDRGEEPLALLGLLARHVRLCWQAKAMLAQGVAAGEIGRRLGVRPFVAEKTVRQARKLDEPYLRRALEAILAADLSIKSGACPPQLALETLCTRLCEVRRRASG